MYALGVESCEAMSGGNVHRNTVVHRAAARSGNERGTAVSEYAGTRRRDSGSAGRQRASSFDETMTEILSFVDENFGILMCVFGDVCV